MNFGSSATLSHVQVEAYCKVTSGGVAVVSDSSFTSNVVSAFQHAGFRIFNATLAVRNSSFLDAVIHEEGGYLLFDQGTLTNSQLDLQRITSPQPLYIDGVVATGNTTAAPFLIRAFDVFFGASNTIQGNLYPVRLETGGISSGSTLPIAGNLNDEISGIARMGSRSTWAKTGLDYVMEWDPNIPKLSGSLTIEPGVTARFQRGQNTTSDVFWFQQFAHLIARGTPEEPILLTDDGAGWGGLFFGDNDDKRPKIEHTIVERADTGVIAKASRVRIESSVLRDNLTGAQSNSAGTLLVRGTKVLNNGIGIETSPGAGGSQLSAGRANLDGGENPNSIAGNGAGVTVLNGSVTVDATDNWWGSSSGPTHPANPGGSGDSATANASVLPFLASEPPADSPPQVKLRTLGDILEEGTRMIVHWEAEDDAGIVSQRIEYSPHGFNPALSTLVGEIHPGARSWEIEVPQSPPSSNIQNPVLRVVAVDGLGQEGWDEATFFTPYEDFSLTFDVITPAALVRPGEQYPVCWTINSGNAYLMIDDVDWSFSLGGTTTNCLSLGLTAPGVSTDLARIAVAHSVGAGGRIRYEYSDYFSIRPDPLIGDAPPAVQILQPLAGTFPSKGTVPLRWTASDDEALRSFLVQASYDGGRSWNEVVDDLPGAATGYDWKLPKSQGLDDVRVRVVARDLRFQASSDTTVISVGAGEFMRIPTRDPAGGLQTKP